MRHTYVSVIFAVVACYGCGSGPGVHAPVVHEQSYVVLDAVQMGTHTAQFYIDYSVDSAILGFSVEQDSGQARYCPMYGSTYRGLPSVTLDVLVSDAHNAMWVISSWPGYDILAYHRLDTDRCITPYGEMTLIEQPTPESLGGGTKDFPEMPIDHVTKVATITYDENHLD
jgi:hypothetical protein